MKMGTGAKIYRLILGILAGAMLGTAVSIFWKDGNDGMIFLSVFLFLAFLSIMLQTWRDNS